ncbi:MAG: AraC family transcriptional regulator [Caulobacterales bacterium]|nr:AraC family transcriptional regulator [Caulobacterales bacterium]
MTRTFDDIAWAPTIRTSLVSTVVAFALARGVAMDDIVAATGLSGLDLVDPDARLPEDVAPKIRLVLEEREGVRPLSVEIARSAPLSILGGLAHGAQFAQDVRGALQLLAKNHAVLADRLQFELRDEDGFAAFALSHPLDAMDRGFGAEFGAGVIWRLIKEIAASSVSLARVDFAHAMNGDDRGPYAAFFGCPVTFGRQRTALVLSHHHLSAPVSQANIEMFAFVHQYFDQARARLRGGSIPEPLRDVHEAVLQNASSGVFSAEAAAARAGMTMRSAQRLAAKYGGSLQAIIDGVRSQSAEELIAASNMNVTQIAQFLGYSDDRAFRRAFKRWTGQSPSQFRRGDDDGSRRGRA